MASQIISHYLVIKKIGAGGMGEVYLAEDPRLGRKVALKLLPPELTNDQHRVLRFKQEARAASALNHPNILTIYDIGETDSAHFIAMEFVKGETLRQRMSNSKMNLQESLDIAIQVASALVAAHEAGIAHRDIKPENIMIRPDEYVKVLDFGLAKLTEREATAIDSTTAMTPLVSTEPGLIIGTPQYMSPEQVRGLDVDARTDIFSLGTVIYEMIAGKPPFQRATVGDLIAAILQVEPPPLTGYSSDVPVELQRIVFRSLCKDREGRYQDIKDLLNDLKRLIQRLNRANEERSTLPAWDNQETVAATVINRAALDTPKEVAIPSLEAPTRITSAKESFPGRLRRHRTSATVIATALLALVILIIFLPKLYKSPEVNINSAKDSTDAQSPATDSTGSQQKLYSQMTESEQTAFVEQQAQRVTTLLGESPRPLSNKAVRAIKISVDGYAERANNQSTELWGEDLRFVFDRASRYAPIIIRSFKQRGVPPILGLYLPMIETEYHECLTSPSSGKGMFLFIPKSAREQGLNPDDRCNVEKAAPAAAQYMSDSIANFGSDSTSMTLVILSFNRGTDNIMRDLRNLRRINPNVERSFWSLLANADGLDIYFRSEGTKYVPKFFAAAIVGENPQAFALRTQPLSSY